MSADPSTPRALPPLLASLLERSSCRTFVSEAIPDEAWELLVSAAQQAPTDATGQLYSAIDVDPGPLRVEIARLAGDQAFVHAAPKFLVICLDVRRLRLLLESRGERLGIKTTVALLFGITDAALFAQNLVVAAASLGYGTCYVGGVQNHSRTIAQRLRLPTGVLPLWGLAVGRPAEPMRPKPRTPAALVIHRNAYRDPTPEELQETFEQMKAATRSGDWLNPIRKYFARQGIMEQREEEFRGLLAQQGFPLES